MKHELLAAFMPFIAWCLMAGLLVWFLIRAQRREDFDASEMLRNDAHKLELGRLLGAACFITHTWAFMSRSLADKITIEEQLFYGLLWSGVPIATQVIEVWRGRTAAHPQQQPGAAP